MRGPTAGGAWTVLAPHGRPLHDVLAAWDMTRCATRSSEDFRTLTLTLTLALALALALALTQVRHLLVGGLPTRRGGDRRARHLHAAAHAARAGSG